jgi:ABC-type glycerol-3-phosphate transport system permease component
MTLEKRALAFIRRWWRPATCIWIAGTMAVHGVVIPLVMLIAHGQMPTDLTGLSLLVTATAAAFAVREYGKIKGVTDDDS